MLFDGRDNVGADGFLDNGDLDVNYDLDRTLRRPRSPGEGRGGRRCLWWNDVL